MPALVLLPGMDGTGDLFAPFVAALEPTVKTNVVRYPADEPLGYEALETFARKALPRDEPYVLLGESFSGPIAISIAASAPPGLVGLVLCATFAKNPLALLGPFGALASIAPVKRMPVWILGRVLMGRYASVELKRQLAFALANVSAPVLRARAQAVLEVDVVAKLRQITVPVLYLQAAEDQVVRGGSAQVITRALPGVDVASFEAPHLLLQVAPAAAASAVTAFALRAERLASASLHPTRAGDV